MRRSTWSSGRSRTRRRSRRSRFGFADRSPGYRLPNAQTKDGVALRSRLRALGVLRASGHEHFRGCLTIPVLDGEGRVGEVYGRRVQKLDPRTATSAHLYLPGPHRGVFNAGVFASTDELIVTECLIDALTLWCAGFRHVTASYGADGSTTEHQAAVETHGIRWVLIAYDRDAAGADQLPAARQAAQAGPHRRRRDRARDHDHDGPGTGRRLRERPRLSPALIIDTGALVSIADTTDPHHDACATLLQNETEQLEGVQAVAMDMWEPFAASVRTHLTDADNKIVFDRYHLMGYLTKAVDTVRKTENRALTAAGDKSLAGSKYLWLYSAENLPERHAERFGTLRGADLKTGRGWAIKENLRHFWTYKRRAWAQKHFNRWYFWATHSRLKPIIDAAKTLKRHEAGLLSYFEHPITNAGAEGLNSRIQAIRVSARGYRNRNHFKTTIYFRLGGLELYPATH